MVVMILKKISFIIINILLLIFTLFLVNCLPIDGINKVLKLGIEGFYSRHYGILEITIDQVEIHPVGGDWKVIWDDEITIDVTEKGLLDTLFYNITEGNLEEGVYTEIRIRVTDVYCKTKENEEIPLTILPNDKDGFKFSKEIEITDSPWNINLTLITDPDSSVIDNQVFSLTGSLVDETDQENGNYF